MCENGYSFEHILGADVLYVQNIKKYFAFMNVRVIHYTRIRENLLGIITGTSSLEE